MKLPAVFKTAAGLVSLLLLAVPQARAQFLDSSAGLGAGLVKLFGETKAFSAKGDLRVFTNKVETLRGPMNFALLDGRIRMDFDLATMKGTAVQPVAIKFMTQAGLNQVASIMRMDKRLIHLVFNRAQSYVDMEIPAAEAEAADKNVQVLKSVLGKETIDKHPCIKTRIQVKNAKGALLLDGTTWNAEDLKGFPVQIAVQTKEGTTLIKFSQVQLTRPAATLFDPPAKFTRYQDQDALLIGAMQKRLPPVTTTASGPATVQATQPAKSAAKPVATQKATTPKPVVTAKPAVPQSKTNTPAAKPAAGAKPSATKK